MLEILREVVGAFESADDLDQAVFELETRGIDRAAFSLLASEDSVVQKLGHRYRDVKEVEDDPNVPRATFFSRVSRLEAEYLPVPALASVGAILLVGTTTLLPILVAAGAGAALGAVLGRLMHERYATRVQEQLARGGILLWVQVRNAHEEQMATDVLQAHAAHDVHTHEAST